MALATPPSPPRAAAPRVPGQGAPPKSALQKFLAFEFGSPVPRKQVTLLTRRFASLLQSGLTPSRALAIMAPRIKHKRLRSVVEQVSMRVKAGARLADALGEHPKIFPPTYVASVAVGEAGGILDRVLHRTAVTLHRTDQVRAKMKGAAAYPVFLLLALCGIGYYLLAKVIPEFKKSFEQLGDQMPPTTKILLWMSDSLNVLGPGILLVVVGGIFGVRQLLTIPGPKRAFGRFLLKVPKVGYLVEASAMTQFCRSFATMLTSGVTVAPSIRMSADTLANLYIAERIREAASRVATGVTVERALEETRVVPPEVLANVNIGESGGRLAEQLELIADFYEEEVMENIEVVGKLMEPIMILLVFGMVSVFVLGIYTALFKVVRMAH